MTRAFAPVWWLTYAWMPLDAAFAHFWRKTYARRPLDAAFAPVWWLTYAWMPLDVGVCAGLVANVRVDALGRGRLRRFGG
jgi:hypothetical protein